jgi:hypothetical protein
MSAPAPIGLAPELGGEIDRAIAEIERSVMEAKLTEDPLRHALHAQATFLRAVERLYVDATLTIGAHVAAAKQPAVTLDMAEITRGASDRVIVELPDAIERMVVKSHWLLALRIAGAAVGLVLLAFGMGWVSHARFEEAPIAAVTGCQPAPQHSGEAWNCTFWTKAPR